MPSIQSRRVVAQFKMAFEHPSEEARKEYLKSHPKANPKKHTVKAPEEESKAPVEEKAEPGEKAKPEGKGTGVLKSLSSKAKAFFSQSSKAVQKFVVDPKHRVAAIKAAGKEIYKAPGAYAKRLVHEAKHEIKEFKEAGAALKDVAKGKKLSDEQKATLKKVGTHLAIAVAAATLTAPGVLAGAVAFSKGMSIKVAAKAALHALEKVHTLNEISHIGHGVLHHVLASEKLSPEEAFSVLIMREVMKELENLDDAAIAEALNDLP